MATEIYAYCASSSKVSNSYFSVTERLAEEFAKGRIKVVKNIQTISLKDRQ